MFFSRIGSSVSLSDKKLPISTELLQINPDMWDFFSCLYNRREELLALVGRGDACCVRF